MQVLIAGVGNVLRGDDGFGVVVAQRLLSMPLPQAVQVMDIGIGGIHLVQELMKQRADALVVIDAIDLGRPPGTLFVIAPEVADVHSMSVSERHDHLADMHYATPERALMLARGLGVLPDVAWIVGCQPADAQKLGEGLSPETQGAVDRAIAQVRRIVEEIGIDWPPPGHG